MRLPIRSTVLAAAMVAASAFPAAAQAPSVMADLSADVAQAEQKLVALARAIPAEKYDWRPADGVRSIGELFLHVAGDNYFIPLLLGVPADPSTGITDFPTEQAFEKRKLNRDAIIAELGKSFAHLKKAMAASTDDKLGDKVSLFGQPSTKQKTWILATTHLHEHLGQGIAYARSNAVVPPWSK